MAKVVIVGAGAAGLFCAREAALRGHSVFVLEHNDRVGKKILISGGGRCNFTHLFSTPQNFISENPHFCKSALARFTPQDFLALVQKYQIDYFEKTRGQLFCKTSAKEITQMLLQECQEVGVNIRLSCHLKSVKKNDTFVLATSQGDFSADALVVATGGLSFPSLGATDWGYQLARQFGHQIIPCRPALTPFLFSEEDQ